jgi:hypothetical protein
VSLFGNQAQASINQSSSGEEGALHLDSGSGYTLWSGSGQTSRESGQWEKANGNVREWTDDFSYSSQHTVDERGHAHGGTFSLKAIQTDKRLELDDSDESTFYGVEESGWRYAEAHRWVDGHDKATEFRTLTTESGSYYDVALPDGSAARIWNGLKMQMGRFWLSRWALWKFRMA